MRVPLPVGLSSRLSSASIDARMINGLSEEKSEGEQVKKRPGLVYSRYDYTNGQGMVGLNGLLYLVYDDKFELGGAFWMPGWTYSPGDVVSYEGSLWEYVDGAGAPPDGWATVGSGGWRIVGANFPAMSTGYDSFGVSSSGLIVRRYYDSISYLSSDGETWGSGLSWTGYAVYETQDGFDYSGYRWYVQYGWTDLGVNYLRLWRGDITTVSLVGYGGASGPMGSFAEDYFTTYILGTTVYAWYFELGSGSYRGIRGNLSGSGWAVFSPNLPYIGPSDYWRFLIDGSTVYAIPKNATTKPVYSSSDFETWTQLTADWGLGPDSLTLAARHDYAGKLVILLSNDDVAVSTDGTSWSKSSYSSHVIPTKFTPVNLVKFGSNWYAGGNSGNWAELLGSRVP